MEEAVWMAEQCKTMIQHCKQNNDEGMANRIAALKDQAMITKTGMFVPKMLSE